MIFSSSCISRKFLDSYRIKNLITYLEKLKDKGLAAMVSKSLFIFIEAIFMHLYNF